MNGAYLYGSYKFIDLLGNGFQRFPMVSKRVQFETVRINRVSVPKSAIATENMIFSKPVHFLMGGVKD